MEKSLTVAQVYQEIAKLLKDEVKSTTVTLEQKDFPVVIVKSESDKITTIDKINDIKIKVGNGEEEVALKDIVSISEENSLPSISHENQERYIKVKGEIDTSSNIGLVSRDFEKNLKQYNVPNGYEVNITGENETINQALFDLVKMVLLAVLLIYLIMVAQFQSLLSPFIIMFTMPLAFTGGLLALFITGTELSVISMLGFLVLAGIVVNNGIVLIDYINKLREEGMDRKEAIILAGKVRLKPILMTALTTILGLLTMAFGLGSGSDMIQPIGIVTVGGLLYATILTLFFVPCLYDTFCKKVKTKVEIEEIEE